MRRKKDLLAFLDDNYCMINGLMCREESRKFNGDVVEVLIDGIMEEMKREGTRSMTREQYEKAEPILIKIKKLEKTKKSINLPPECYSVELGTASGSGGVVLNSNDIGSSGVGKLVSLFKECIDTEIKRLEDRLEEI